MKENINFVAYEDNGGSIYLFILDDDRKAVAGFGNFEITPGSLRESIANISEYNLFGGDFGGDIPLPTRFKRYENGKYELVEVDVEEIHLEFANDETSTMIAWSYDGTVNYCDIKRMGYGARLALNIEEVDDD